MYEQVKRPKENNSRTVANFASQKKNAEKQDLWFVDNRPQAISQLASKNTKKINSRRQARDTLRTVIPRKHLHNQGEKYEVSSALSEGIEKEENPVVARGVRKRGFTKKAHKQLVNDRYSYARNIEADNVSFYRVKERNLTRKGQRVPGSEWTGAASAGFAHGVTKNANIKSVTIVSPGQKALEDAEGNPAILAREISMLYAGGFRRTKTGARKGQHRIDIYEKIAKAKRAPRRLLGPRIDKWRHLKVKDSKELYSKVNSDRRKSTKRRR